MNEKAIVAIEPNYVCGQQNNALLSKKLLLEQTP